MDIKALSPEVEEIVNKYLKETSQSMDRDYHRTMIQNILTKQQAGLPLNVEEQQYLDRGKERNP